MTEYQPQYGIELERVVTDGIPLQVDSGQVRKYRSMLSRAFSLLAQKPGSPWHGKTDEDGFVVEVKTELEDGGHAVVNSDTCIAQIEAAVGPCRTIRHVEEAMQLLDAELVPTLDAVNLKLLGLGGYPFNTPEDLKDRLYLTWRNPNKAPLYDAIFRPDDKRGYVLNHPAFMAMIAVQPSIDVPVEKSGKAVSALRHLSGLSMWMFGNGSYFGGLTHYASARRKAWDEAFTDGNKDMNGFNPHRLPMNAQQGLMEIFERTPLCMGYKGEPINWIPAGNFTFEDMVKNPNFNFPFYSYDGKETVIPGSAVGLNDILASSWQSSFSSRIRFYLRDTIITVSAQELLEHITTMDTDAFNEWFKTLAGTYIEAREPDTQPPSLNLLTLAFYAGICHNADAVLDYCRSKGMDFWSDLYRRCNQATYSTQTAQKGLTYAQLGEEVAELARDGLSHEDKSRLNPLFDMLNQHNLPQTQLFRSGKKGGQQVVKDFSY